jgi:hypothetical protein
MPSLSLFSFFPSFHALRNSIKSPTNLTSSSDKSFTLIIWLISTSTLLSTHLSFTFRYLNFRGLCPRALICVNTKNIKRGLKKPQNFAFFSLHFALSLLPSPQHEVCDRQKACNGSLRSPMGRCWCYFGYFFYNLYRYRIRMPIFIIGFYYVLPPAKCPLEL